MTVTRYALVSNATSEQQLDAYLPRGYRVIGDAPAPDPRREGDRVYVIQGRDEAGWTLDGYVIPRLQSGLLFATEIDLSHPIMRSIPEERDISQIAPHDVRDLLDRRRIVEDDVLGEIDRIARKLCDERPTGKAAHYWHDRQAALGRLLYG